MNNLTKLAVQLEEKAINKKPIETEKLQKLINLMLINISEGENIVRIASRHLNKDKGVS